MGYCEHCQREVILKAKFSWIWFLVHLFTTGIGAPMYIIYWLLFKKKTLCKLCSMEVK